MTDGKKLWPVRYATLGAGMVFSVGPSSCLIGLYPRKAAKRLDTGGRCASRLAVDDPTPFATSPWKSRAGSEADRPTMMSEKKMPIDRTWEVLPKVVATPAPAPRCCGGRLF